jgi:hypothetical protein
VVTNIFYDNISRRIHHFLVYREKLQFLPLMLQTEMCIFCIPIQVTPTEYILNPIQLEQNKISIFIYYLLFLQRDLRALQFYDNKVYKALFLTFKVVDEETRKI